MQSDIEALVQRNEAITAAENVGDLAALGEFIAPRLAFVRRDGSFVDREAFLQASRPGHRELRIESVQVFGARAVVACIVTDLVRSRTISACSPRSTATGNCSAGRMKLHDGLFEPIAIELTSFRDILMGGSCPRRVRRWASGPIDPFRAR